MVKHIKKIFGSKCKTLLGAALVCGLFVMSGGTQAQTAFENPGVRGAGGSGGLIPVEAEIEGGVISIGSTAQVVVLFRNEGGSPVNTGIINLYPSSNASANVTMNQCGQEPLDGGAECAIAISVKGLQAGAWRVAMLMRHDGRSRLVSTVLSGTIESAGEGNDQIISDVEAIPSELDFETLNASRAQLKSVTLRNITSNPITISDISLKAEESSGLSLESECDVLNAGESCLVTVKWSPAQRGPSSGVIIIKHSGPSGLTTVEVEGEYTPESSTEAEIFPDAVPGKGLMVSSLSEIDFGGDVDTISAITTSLVNAGDADLRINNIELSGSESGLEVINSGCVPGEIIAPLDACALTLSWGPVREGTLLDDVKILHTGARGVLILPVRGEASEAVSKDSQSIVLNASPGFSLDPYNETVERDNDRSAGNMGDTGGSAPSKSKQVVSNAKVLDGYSITSLAADRAIISSPRGSRVIFHREPLVIAGVTWVPYVQYSGVEFRSGADKVLMLFDRSLSSFNSSGASSNGGSASSAASDDE